MKKIREMINKRSVVTFMLLFYDGISVFLAYGLALWLRFDCRFSAIETKYLSYYSKTILVFTLWTLMIYSVFRIYNSIWKFAGYLELARAFSAVLISILSYILAAVTFSIRMPISYYLFGGVLQFCLCIGVRFCYRFVTLLLARNSNSLSGDRVLLYGAGTPAA